MVAIEVSPAYGWVVLGAGILPVITSFYLSAVVMKARDTCDIQYPNAYATPGFHKKADEFNRAQRSHQNYLENIGMYVTLALIGGLKHPITNAIGSVLFCAGSILYQMGYVDTSLDVKTARHQKGSFIKYFGLLAALYSTGAFAYDLINA